MQRGAALARVGFDFAVRRAGRVDGTRCGTRGGEALMSWCGGARDLKFEHGRCRRLIIDLHVAGKTVPTRNDGDLGP